MDFNKNIIYAAIAGDIAGSLYEGSDRPYIQPSFDNLIESGHFTDDTVLTIAVLDALKHGYGMAQSFSKWARKYPNCGFSKKFKEMFVDIPESSFFPTGIASSANGAIMMLSPFIALQKSSGKFDFLKEGNPMQRLDEAVNVSHDCDLARKVAYAYVFNSKDILPFLPNYAELKKEHMFDMSAFGTLLRAAACYAAGNSLEDVILNAISLGGDTDTTASIAAVLYARGSNYSEEMSHMIDMVHYKLTGEMLKVIEKD